jgi:hypothetical protein
MVLSSLRIRTQVLHVCIILENRERERERVGQ